jgi:transcriptional regulator with XRE-family HTH domain
MEAVSEGSAMNRGEIESVFYAELGRKLRAMRKTRKISKCALAVEIGAHRNTIQRWENGETAIESLNLLRICDVLTCHPSALLPAGAFVWGDELKALAAERDPKRCIRFERDPTGPDLHTNSPQIRS